MWTHSKLLHVSTISYPLWRTCQSYHKQTCFVSTSSSQVFPGLPRSSELLLVVHTEAEPFGGSTSLGQRGQLLTGRKAATLEARLHQAEAAGHVERGITKGSVVLGNIGKWWEHVANCGKQLPRFISASSYVTCFGKKQPKQATKGDLERNGRIEFGRWSVSLTQDTMKAIATNLHLGLGAWVIRVMLVIPSILANWSLNS